MAQAEATLRQTWLNTIVRVFSDIAGSLEVKRTSGSLEIVVPATTVVADTVNVPAEALHENHPLASISGLLENHPLRDEYLEALGITE